MNSESPNHNLQAEEQKEPPTQSNIPTQKLDIQNGQNSLPDIKFDVVQLQKSGAVTIPKHVREKLGENPSFAVWMEEERVIMQKLTKEQLLEISLQKEMEKKTQAHSTSASGSSKSRTAPKKKKTKASPKSGPEPELTTYFPFQFEHQDKIMEILESTFYILFEESPQVSESLERLKYGLIKFSTGKKTNDARLKHSYILFIKDVLLKNSSENLDPLLDFAYTKLLPQMHSRFLQEQARIELFFLASRRNLNELSNQLLSEILHGIELYQENYAIMQGFKNLVKPIQNDEFYLNPDLKYLIYNKIKEFIEGFEIKPDEDSPAVVTHPQMSTDNALELIELLVGLQLIEEAFQITQNLLDRLPPDDIFIDQTRKLLTKLKRIEL